MGRDLTNVEKTTLEVIIDNVGLCAVLQAMSEICAEKADHIDSSYSDGALSMAWRSAAGVIGVMSTERNISRIGEP